MHNKHSPAEIQRHLKGVTYPAKKEDVVSKARENGAPEEVLSMIENMPENEFQSADEVSKAFATAK